MKYYLYDTHNFLLRQPCKNLSTIIKFLQLNKKHFENTKFVLIHK